MIMIFLMLYSIYILIGLMVVYQENKNKINDEYKTHIKGLCCCLESQYCPAKSEREINKYEYFFTYSVNGMLYKTSRYHCNNNFCKNGDIIEIYVNPYDFTNVYIPKFEDDTSEVLLKAVKRQVSTTLVGLVIILLLIIGQYLENNWYFYFA